MIQYLQYPLFKKPKSKQKNVIITILIFYKTLKAELREVTAALGLVNCRLSPIIQPI